MTKKEKELNMFYQEVLNKFDKYTDKYPGDFIEDVTLLNNVLLSEQYQFGFESFWEYFIDKHSIKKDVQKYFKDDHEFARTLYYKCVTPLNMKLDIVPLEFKPDSSVYKSFFHGILRKVRYSVKELIMSTLAVSIIFTSVILSFYYYEEELFWYSNLFIGLATGVLAGVVIKWVNSYIRNNIVLLESQKVLASRYTKNYVSKIEESIKEFIKANNENSKEDIILSFVNVNNYLNDYMKRIVKFKIVKTLKQYFSLVKFEEEIFDYSKEIVRRLYPMNIEKLSTKEIETLNLYVLKLKQQLEEYIMEYGVAIQKIDFTIQRMKTKVIG